MARFPGESGKEKTSVRTGFANMPLACWIEVGSNPPLFSSPAKGHQLCWRRSAGEGGFDGPLSEGKR